MSLARNGGIYLKDKRRLIGIILAAVIGLLALLYPYVGCGPSLSLYFYVRLCAHVVHGADT